MLKFSKESKGKAALNIEDEKPKAQKEVTKNLQLIAKGRGRKMYETEADLKTEEAVREKLSAHFKAAYDKMPISYGLDWMITKNNKVQGVTEFKRRKGNHDKYPTFMISMLKFNKGLDFFYKWGIRFSLVIQFDNGIFRYVYKEGDMDKIKIEFSGRTHTTRDSADLEPVVRIPVQMFQKVQL